MYAAAEDHDAVISVLLLAKASLFAKDEVGSLDALGALYRLRRVRVPRDAKLRSNLFAR